MTAVDLATVGRDAVAEFVQQLEVERALPIPPPPATGHALDTPGRCAVRLNELTAAAIEAEAVKRAQVRHRIRAVERAGLVAK